MNKSEQLRRFVVQGWTVMAFVFTSNLVMDQVRIMIEGSQVAWAKHMGTQGLPVVLVVLTVYALMPLLVSAISAKWFRYTTVGITAFITLFVIAHEISHLLTGDKPFGILHALDLTHSLVGIAVIVAGSLWVQQPD